MKTTTGKSKQSTREIILETLKLANQAKVEELADAANVSPVTVRHHLNSLQAEDLIEVSSVRRKVGRPYYVYSLSEEGHELFPQRYIRLTNRLLDELKATLPDEVIQQLFNGMVRNIVDQHRSKLEKLSFEERLTFLVELLAEEGFMARWEKVDGEYKITEFSCPYYSVVGRHSEICALDKELMVNVLQTPIQQHTCMINGDNCCEFTFSANGAS